VLAYRQPVAHPALLIHFDRASHARKRFFYARGAFLALRQCGQRIRQSMLRVRPLERQPIAVLLP
jgi:hypothetical protein